MSESPLDRRRFLQTTLGAAGAVALGANLVSCSSSTSPPIDDAGLTPDAAPIPDVAPVADLAADTIAADLPPPLPHRFLGYEGLAELPFFELDGEGRLRCTVSDLPPGVDFHVHLGFRFLTAPKIDYLAQPVDFRYLLDQIEGDPPFDLDLDRYLNTIATQAMKTKLDVTLGSAGTVGSKICKAHTIPALLRELDAMGLHKAVIHPIVLNLPFGDDAPNDWLDALEACDAATRARLICYGCVHPNNNKALDKLAAQVARGITGIKLHPCMQRVYPDAAECMAVYGACATHGLDVFWHGGRTGIEPDFTAKYAEGKYYAAPLADYPSVRFIMGHSGAAQDWQATLALAKLHKNLYLDIAGQGIPALEEIIKTIGPERLFLGSDWPFYPEAATLAKVLLITRSDTTVRNLIVRDNAEAFLAAS